MGVKDICAVILAGGKSQRMGTPKEHLAWGGTTLIEHLSMEAVAAGLACLIVSNEPERLPTGIVAGGISVTSDLVHSAGPVSGIVTGFRARQEEALLTLSCDLPFMDRKQINKLIGYANGLAEEWDVVAVRGQGRLHPLCAIYHRRTHLIWEEALQTGQLRLMSILERLRVRETPEDLLDEWAVFNANTPEEYQEALKEEKRRKTGLL